MAEHHDDAQTVPADRKAFFAQLNLFFEKNGVMPVAFQNYVLDEEKLMDFALFLRGYMRDAQNLFADLRNEYAVDPDLVDLFKSASEYIVAASRRIGGKKSFNNHEDYYLWKFLAGDNLQQSGYVRVESEIDVSKPNMFLFMPFRIKGQEQEVRKWVFMNMRSSMDNQALFGSHVDVYVNHFPIQKSRSSNIYSLLKTQREPETYFEAADVNFVRAHWLNFIGTDVKLADDGKVLSGQPYPPAQLEKNLGNLSIFSYCSGAANAHRCLNVLYSAAVSLYGEKEASKAMKNVGVLTYGFLPLQECSRYSGIHFYTNAVDDVNRHEPFVNLNNHYLYERTKCVSQNKPASYSVMPDKRNIVIALRMPESMSVWQDGKAVPFRDAEFGHSIRFVTEKNITDKDNYAYHLFRTAFENFSTGVRGFAALDMNGQQNSGNVFINSFLINSAHRL